MVDGSRPIRLQSGVSLTSAVRVVRLAAAVLAAALLAGCAGDEPGATQPAEQEAPEDGAGDGVPTASESAGESDSSAASSDGEPEIDPVFLYRRAPRLLPHDYEIGPLQDLLAPGPTERAAIDTLLSFLAALAEGTIAEAAIAPDRRQTLSRSLRFHVRDGVLPRAARIGALIVAEDEVQVAVRLFGDPGRVAGEAYLEATPDGWRVVDLQVDLHRLAQPYTAPAEFVPSIAPRLLRYP